MHPEWLEIDSQRQTQLLFSGRVDVTSRDDPHLRVEAWSTYAYRILVQYGALDIERWRIFLKTARGAYDLLDRASRNRRRDLFLPVLDAVNAFHQFLPEHFPLYAFANAGPAERTFRESRERYLDLGESMYRQVMAPFVRALAITTGQDQSKALALNSAKRITVDALDVMRKFHPRIGADLTHGFHRNVLTALRHRNFRELSASSLRLWVDSREKKGVAWSEDWPRERLDSLIFDLTATLCALVQATLLFYRNNWRRAVQRHWAPMSGHFDITEPEADRLTQASFVNFGIHCLRIDAQGKNRRVAIQMAIGPSGDFRDRLAWDENGVEERISYFRHYSRGTVTTLLGMLMTLNSRYWGVLGEITFEVFCADVPGGGLRRLGAASTEGWKVRSLPRGAGGDEYQGLFTKSELDRVEAAIVWEDYPLNSRM